MNHLRYICSLDPISLTGLAIGALGSLGGAAASGAFSSTPSTPAPAAPPAAPAAQQSPTQGTNTPKAAQPTFLGAAATPPVQSGSKTLLGA